jgi:alginate O-acetyltransferase complex protein AlgI
VLFNSFEFIFIFLPIAGIAYFGLRAIGRDRASIIALLVASAVFYVYGERTYWWLIACSILFNFLIGERIRLGKTASNRRAWLIIGVAGDLLAIIVFKYTGFLAGVLAQAGLISPVVIHIALPIGISFFTFTQIAYIVDVHRNAARDYDPVSYSLFVTFFPHLVAGPILHHKEMMPQFGKKPEGRILEYVADGLAIFALGLFKKTVIADTAAPVADLLFAQAHGGPTPHFIAAWGAALSYTVQIYFDFSGYSDMAIGLARMLGIDLPINFNSPYKASSISDFWRRWHITLSRFLRDYVYISLGGNRLGKVRRYANLFLTMLIGGIWHGAGWTFILWGALHGAYLAINHLWTSLSGKIGIALPRVAAHALTLILVIFAWVPFRAPDLPSTFALWRGMIGLGGFAWPSNWPHGAQTAQLLGVGAIDLGVDGSSTAAVMLMLLACLFLPNSQEILAPGSVGLDSPGYSAKPSSPSSFAVYWWRTPMMAAGLGLILGLAIRTIGGYSAFIYFQF